MADDYMCELLERAFLLQQKRLWSLETLLRIERGQLLAHAPTEHRAETRRTLEGNLRVALESLDDVAREIGYESSAGKLLDPTFVVGAPDFDPNAEIIERIDALESESGIRHHSAMRRELSVQHAGYFEHIQSKVRADVEFYRQYDGIAPTIEPNPGPRTTKPEKTSQLDEHPPRS
jgi:hypothetical protein